MESCHDYSSMLSHTNKYIGFSEKRGEKYMLSTIARGYKTGRTKEIREQMGRNPGRTN